MTQRYIEGFTAGWSDSKRHNNKRQPKPSEASNEFWWGYQNGYSVALPSYGGGGE